MSLASGNQSKKRTVEVQLLGQRMILKADDDPGRVERLAAYVKGKLDEISVNGPVNASKLALLAALNIADDYFKAVSEASEFKRQVVSKSRGMLADLEK